MAVPTAIVLLRNGLAAAGAQLLTALAAEPFVQVNGLATGRAGAQLLALFGWRSLDNRLAKGQPAPWTEAGVGRQYRLAARTK
jgi:hypothetical protein